jgi:structural maintenance of chromosome 2
MKKEQSQLEDKIRDLTREANALKQQVKGLEFSYRDPYPNFDRTKVKGVLAQLFSLDEDKFNTGLALEMCAGGRLYNVVSDTADTAALLLDEKKALCSRKVTMIPLDKILFHQLPPDVIAAAEKMAPGKVNLALSLIEYEAEVAPAMKYVFSHTFICQDNNVAKQVAFDPKTRSRCVTLLGDIYEPTGTLTGGSAPSSAGILLKIQKINALDRQVAEAANRLAEINETMRREAQKLARAREIRRDLELKNHEIRLAEEQINSNSSSSIIQAVEQMKEEIATAQEAISDAKNRQQAASAEVKKIEKDMKEFKNNKGAKLGELQKNLKKLKESNIKQSEALKGFREEFQNAQVELEQVESDLSAAKEAQEEVDAAIEAQQTEVDELAEKHKEAKEVHDMALAELSDERTKLSGFDEELKALEAASRKKSAQIAEEALEKQKLGHEVSKFHSQQQGSVEALNRLEREYPWIEEEQEQFGLQGTPYDFNSIRINEAKTQLKDLTERSAGQKKKVNPKVMNMIDSVEKKEVALKTMLRTVVKDKRKIEDTIIELDRYKKEALHKTHEKVSADFGAIFNDLLQGSSAKLVAPEGKDMTEGLEVKVQLGKVWKQSLTELSGGQRSLIALSLILALLQFKPAPMYILDEVDAALDLSHTQNIGRLIKNRFGGSQFIVVSLKDGMFQNANRYVIIAMVPRCGEG